MRWMMASRAYGRIHSAVLAQGGQPRRRFADLLIAAVALAEDLPLITRNPHDFKRFVRGDRDRAGLIGRHVRVINPVARGAGCLGRIDGRSKQWSAGHPSKGKQAVTRCRNLRRPRRGPTFPAAANFPLA